jgi:hypothetical protein
MLFGIFVFPFLLWLGTNLLYRYHMNDATFGRHSPTVRYLAATVYKPSHTLHWRSEYNHYTLYNASKPSGRSNYMRRTADSLFVFGGFDGSTGSVYDGWFPEGQLDASAEAE